MTATETAPTETVTTPTGTAVEKLDSSPKGMIAQYRGSFEAVLPSHITKPETWIRLAQGALKKGKKLQDGRTELEVAAANNPGMFLATLLDCARQGLEPGTEQYYLTPRKVGGKLEILGIVGYQGYIELMYRAGAVTSVVAEVVYANDRFEFRPGRDEIPLHEIDWDSDDRGSLRLVYAFARMQGGATSKVIVLNRQAIATIKKKAQGSDSQYSPWNTDEPSMWLKSAVRQLRKWVPTSAEYRREALHAQADVAGGASRTVPARSFDAPDLPSSGPDDEIIDAVLIDDEDEPTAPEPDTNGAEPMTDAQSRALHAILRQRGHTGDARFPVLSEELGREITTTKQVSADEASMLIARLQDGGAIDDTPEPF